MNAPRLNATQEPTVEPGISDGHLRAARDLCREHGSHIGYGDPRAADARLMIDVIGLRFTFESWPITAEIIDCILRRRQKGTNP